MLADLRSALRREWGGTSLGRWESVNGAVLADLRSACVKVYRGWRHPAAVKDAGNVGATRIRYLRPSLGTSEAGISGRPLRYSERRRSSARRSETQKNQKKKIILQATVEILA